ncbi:hypothetical protein SAMN02745121_05652 [Nannocystis exedens]|uniref:Uncharacterized protein n=1 Tax=Nannocystis exedens TaxID=54 RepID=A0A1I2DQT1_9BACT|nr:hypothetical protein [Nannocystis exedens]PCC69015.1 hypothetical protein NAEX_02037 [Nannocystis exedens]SFE82250.1 hypothetical protein SAMN02745121_05652 [Nannocystis exedens]
MADASTGLRRGRTARRSLAATSGVVVGLSFVAVAAASPGAAASPDSCAAWLAQWSEHAAARGYVLTPGASGITGLDGVGNTLQADCAADRALMSFAAPDATHVRVEWSAAALTVRGEFPGVGRVDQSWDAASHRLRHTAEVGAAAAAVEFDPATGDWLVDGDPDALNAALEPVLIASTPWRDAYFVIHAITGVWDSGLERDEAGLQAALSLALPPSVCQDVDKGSVKKDCGATIGICAAAYFWKPLTAACLASGAKCLAAFKCWKSDCSGDGKQ